MFQKVHKNRVLLLDTLPNTSKNDNQAKLQIKMKTPQEKKRKTNGSNSSSKERIDEKNKSKDSFKKDKQQTHTSSLSDKKQLNLSKDSLQKDSIKEDKEQTNELRQSNLSYASRRRSDMSSSNSRQIKDLSSLDYLRLKREQSRERGEFYDMGGSSYKNYKYEKLKLQRPEFSFLQSKPLDFFGKGLPFNRNRNSNGNCTEKAISNIQRQHDIINLGEKQMSQSQDLKQSKVYQEIKQKRQNDMLLSQEREYPFEKNQRIAKGLAKLENHIKQKNNSDSHLQSFSIQQNDSIQNNDNLMFPSLNSAKNHQNVSTPNLNSSSVQNNKNNSSGYKNKRQDDKKWLSPLVKYESIENLKYMPNQNKISKTDLILKNELFQNGQPDPESKKAYDKLRNKNKIDNHSNHHHHHHHNSGMSDHHDEHSEGGDGICISIIHLNKAFKGRGQKMHSLLQHDEKAPNKHKLMGEVVKTFNKKTQYFLVVEEFNRLLNLDRIEQARQRTKKIKTKMDKKINEQQLFNKIATLDHCISQEIFLRETFFFDQYIRSEPQIRERLLYGITNLHNGIDFESYLNFYQIFVFKNTKLDILISFLSKYFIYNKSRSFTAITVEEFKASLLEIINNSQLIDKEECYKNWEQGLSNMKQITITPDSLLRQKHLEIIFQSFVINPNLILKLLFK